MGKNTSDMDLPTPADFEEERRRMINSNVGFDQVLRYLALGMSPTAPRLPQQGIQYGSMFGGYPKGYTNRIGTKGALSFFTLRSVAQRSPLLSAIVSRRLHQVTRYSKISRQQNRGEVGYRVLHRRESDKDFRVPDGFKILCREVEQMLRKPWQVFWDDKTILRDVEPSMSSFLSKITEDILICNRPVIELGLDPLRVPRAFGAIDGANIIPTFAALRYLTSVDKDVPMDFSSSYGNYVKTMQRVSDKYFISIDERTAYIYLLDGRPVTAFREDELLVAPMFHTSDVRYAGYPPSLVERSIYLILSEIMAMAANSKFFEYGSMAEVLVSIKGNHDDRHVRDLESIFLSNLSGVQGMYRVPIIATPGGTDDIEVIQLKQNHRDMLFDVYIQKLTNLACAVFAMDPSEINEAPRAGDNTGGMSQPNRTLIINRAQEEGLESLLQHMKQHIFDPIIERIDPDLCFEWDYGRSEQEQLAIAQQYASISTLNERRQMVGMEPISKEDGGEVIDNQFVTTFKQTEDSKQQQAEAQKAQAGQAEAGGEPSAAEEGSDEGDTGEQGNPEAQAQEGEAGAKEAQDTGDAQGINEEEGNKGDENLKGFDQRKLIDLALKRHRAKASQR